MPRFPKMAVGLLLILSMTGGNAHAQWGYDGWGFMGWNPATPESAELQAAGIFAMGAGIYNLKTAEANFIDAQTAMKFNDYVAQVTRESARIHAERVDRRIARNRSLYDARQKQLRAESDATRYPDRRCLERCGLRPERSQAGQIGLAGGDDAHPGEPHRRDPFHQCGRACDVDAG